MDLPHLSFSSLFKTRIRNSTVGHYSRDSVDLLTALVAERLYIGLFIIFDVSLDIGGSTHNWGIFHVVYLIFLNSTALSSQNCSINSIGTEQWRYLGETAHNPCLKDCPRSTVLYCAHLLTDLTFDGERSLQGKPRWWIEWRWHLGTWIFMAVTRNRLYCYFYFFILSALIYPSRLQLSGGWYLNREACWWRWSWFTRCIRSSYPVGAAAYHDYLDVGSSGDWSALALSVLEVKE